MTEKTSTKQSPQGSLSRLKTFEGAVCIVTGGSSGLGHAVAEELGNRKVRTVVILDRSDAGGEEEFVASVQTNSGHETKFYKVDVRNFEDVDRVVKETKRMYGRLDYIFNNAGILAVGSIEDVGVDGFNYVLDVNLRGVANGVYAAYPIMKEQGFGHIVNSIAIAGLCPFGDLITVYGASKYGVVGLTMNLRVEAARHGVYVSALSPNVVRSPILRGGTYGMIPETVSRDELGKFFEEFHPMDPKKFAVKALNQVAKNKPIIMVPAGPFRTLFCIHRLFPNFGLFLARRDSNKRVKRFERAIEQTKNEDIPEKPEDSPEKKEVTQEKE
jgi:NAD(P)-dependent dehydrogenase (short-subunit alcohol dehydrogenase family)